MMLTQQENNKLKERDEKHTQELREWRADLTKRRQVMWQPLPTPFKGQGNVASDAIVLPCICTAVYMYMYVL